MIKKIHQLSKTEKIKDFELKSQRSLKKHNPNYTYKLWTDNKIKEIVEIHHKRLNMAWDNLKGIHRSDLGRYLILYLEGGFYCDTDFYVFKSFDDLDITDDIFLSPSTRDFLFMKNGLTNYFIYSPPGKKFFLDLIEESLDRIEKTFHTDPSYISYTSGKILIDYVIKKENYKIKSFSEKKIINKYCSHTKTKGSFGYHDGNTSREGKKDPWLNSKVLKLMDLECKSRKILRVPGNICQIPIIMITLFLILFFVCIKYNRIIIEKIKDGILLGPT